MTVAWNADVTLNLEAAFGFGAKAASPTWTDISTYLRRAEIRRGRSNERDKVQAGTFDFILDNTDRRFDPTNTTGPYQPNIVPGVPVRLRAVHNTVTYNLFRGTIGGWPLVYPDKAGADALVAVKSTDDFKLLGLDAVSGSEVLEKSGVRIGNILDTLSWPAGRRNIATGAMDVEASTFQCQKPLSEIQKVVDSEVGLFFMAGNGDATFQDQNYRGALVSSGTFSDNPSGAQMPYDDLVFSYDDEQLWNEIVGTRVSGEQRTVEDAASVSAYGRRRLTLNELLLTSTADLDTVIGIYLARYKDPGVRAQTLRLKPEMDPTNLWPEVLGAELSDKYVVERDPPGGGTPTTISQTVHVEKMDHSITPSDWVTTWQLSPA